MLPFIRSFLSRGSSSFLLERTLSEKSSLIKNFVPFRHLALLMISSLSLNRRSLTVMVLGLPSSWKVPFRCALSTSISLGSILKWSARNFLALTSVSCQVSVFSLFWRFTYSHIVVPLIAYKGNYSSYLQGLNAYFICCVKSYCTNWFYVNGVLYYSFLLFAFFAMSVWSMQQVWACCYLCIMRPICAEWLVYRWYGHSRSDMVTRAVNQSVSRSRTIAKCFARNLQLETARCGRKVEGYSRFTISVFRAVGSTVYRQTEVRLPSVRSTSVSRGECYPGARARGPVARGTQEEAGFPRSRRGSWGGFKTPLPGSTADLHPIYKGGVPPLQRPPLVSGQFQLTPFSPPHSTCTNDSAAPHYEHEDIRQAHRRASGRTVCVRAVWLGWKGGYSIGGGGGRVCIEVYMSIGY